MAGAKTIRKFFESFIGLDKRSSDLTRDINAASILRNAVFLLNRSLSLSKRRGSKPHRDEGAYLGLHTYRYGDQTTGETKEELLSLEDELYKLTASDITITYSGSATSSTFQLLMDESTLTYHAIIDEAGTVVLDEDLGLGDEATPYTMADLKTAIDLVADYAAVITGTTTAPAAILPLNPAQDLKTNGVLPYYEETIIPSPLSSPLSDYAGKREDETFQLASMVNMSDVAYVGTKFTELYKYDGQKFYRAGLPKPDTVTAAPGAAGGRNNPYRYIVTYAYTDAAGNIFESTASEVSNEVTPSLQVIDVTIPYIQDTTGFNTGIATVNGAQVGVNVITVDSGHDFIVGDTAFFLDGVSSANVEREVTAVSATTITVAGAAVDVTNNQIISNNLRVRLYRNKAGGTFFYEVTEIPNDSSSTNIVFNDDTPDGSLGAQYIYPIKNPDPPPKGGYLAVHQGLLCIAGKLDEPNTVYYSDESPEAFPAASNAFDVIGGDAGPITGIGSAQDVLHVFKENGIAAVSGDLFNDAFRIDFITEGAVGCSSHHSIKDVNGELMFLSKLGFYLQPPGQPPLFIGDPIAPAFKSLGSSEERTLRLVRSLAVNDRFSEHYICYLPTETESGVVRYPNNNSLLFVYDYRNQTWFEWNAVLPHGGMAIYQEELYWLTKELDGVDTRGRLFKRHNTGTPNDYADREAGIDWEYGTQWDAAQEPSLFKKFLRLKLYSVHPEIASSFLLKVITEKDYKDGVAHTEKNVQFGGSSGTGGYGIPPWGTFPWGSPSTRSKRLKLKSGKAQNMRFRFSNDTIHENVVLTGWEYEVRFPYRKAIKE